MFDQRLCSLPDNDGGADDGNERNGCNGDYAGITGVGSLGRLNRSLGRLNGSFGRLNGSLGRLSGSFGRRFVTGIAEAGAP